MSGWSATHPSERAAPRPATFGVVPAFSDAPVDRLARDSFCEVKCSSRLRVPTRSTVKDHSNVITYVVSASGKGAINTESGKCQYQPNM